ncbi:hypothetical protein BH11BAC5_BH11BAC5_48050 [soil metagenome]
MKKAIYLCFLSLLSFMTSQAQSSTNSKTSASVDGAISTVEKNKADTTVKDGWMKAGTINISLTELGQNNYWTAVKGGGNTSFFGVKGIISYDFNRKKGKTNWLNSFNGRYAGASSAIYVPATNSSVSSPFTKSDDYLNFSSIYGKEFAKNWSYAAFFSLESQFERFMTPGYIKLGPAFLYKPSNHFNLLLSPAMINVTTKLTASSKPLSLFGVDAGKKAAVGLGAYARASMSYNLSKGILYTSNADIYSNYLKNPGNLILNWNNLFAFTVNKYIAATLSFNFRYNDLEYARVQAQHGIGIGFNYKF